MLAKSADVIFRALRGQMVRTKVKLVQTRIPNPIRRVRLTHRRYQLAAKYRPAVVTRQTVPTSPTRLEERVPRLESLPALPQRERCACAFTRMFASHFLRIASLCQE